VERRGTICVLLAVLAWSTVGVSSRLIQSDTASLIFWRSAFGFAFTTALLAGRRWRGLGAPSPAPRWPTVAIILASASGTLLYQVSLRLAPVADVLVLYGTMPLVAALLGWLLSRVATRATTLVASACAVGGVAIGLGGGLVPESLAAIATGSAMTFAYAVMTVLAARHHTVPALLVVAAASLVVATAALPWADPLASRPADILLLAAVALVQITLADVLFLRGARVIAPARAALLTLLEIPVSSGLAWLVAGEAMSVATAAGGAIVMSAVGANILIESQRPRRAGRAGEP
jgi:drug/metabolite transporter (DMT)-like permease